MNFFALSFSLLITFGVLAKGAHDLWAATVVYLAVLGLGLAALLHSSWNEDDSGVPARFAAPLAAIALIFSLSFARSINPSESLLGLLDWLSAIILFLTALHVFKSDRAVKTFLAGVVPVIILEFFILLYQQSVIAAPLSTQPPGTLINSNLAAAFLLLWVPVLWSQARSSRIASGKIPWYWIAGLAADLAAILLCRSEWAVICLVLGLPFIIGTPKFIQRMKARPGWSALGSAFLLLALTGLFWWKFHHVTDFTNRTERLAWWAEALRMFGDYPWLGVGIGNYPSASPAYAALGGQHAIYAHSFSFGLLAETGALGFLSFFLFLGWWSRRAVRAPYFAGALLFLLYGSINLSWEYLVNLLVFWLFLAIAAASEAPQPYWKPQKAAVIILVALGFFAVPYLLSPLLASRICVAAEKQLQLGQVDVALQNFGSASALDPLSYEAHRGRARAFYLRSRSQRGPGDLENAVRHQKKALELNKLSGPLRRELEKYIQAQAAAGGPN